MAGGQFVGPRRVCSSECVLLFMILMVKKCVRLCYVANVRMFLFQSSFERGLWRPEVGFVRNLFMSLIGLNSILIKCTLNSTNHKLAIQNNL